MGRILTEENKAKLLQANLGRHLTEEHKIKLSQANLGKKRTEETKAKMRQAGIGRRLSEETRAKISRSHMGKTLTEEHKAKIGKASLGNKYRLGIPHTDATKAKLHLASLGRVPSEETRAKLRLSSTGRHHTEETKAKIGRIKKGNKNMLGHHHTEEAKLKMRLARIGKTLSEEANIKLHEANIGNTYALGHKHNEETRVRMSKSHKSKWQDAEYRDSEIRRLRLACCAHPNKPEATILELLNAKYPEEWKFVGDGSLIIEGLNPDIVNANGRKLIIEVFGDYWHTQKLKPYRLNEGRVRVYAKYGYKTLIIWVSELNNIRNVMVKIDKFIARY